MVPVEAMASGKPVVCLGRGGALETVIDGVTGVLFEEQTVGCLVDAIRRFEAQSYGFDASAIRARAEQFSEAIFKRNFKAFVERALTEAGRPSDP